jgi:hypothetical protein
MSKKDQQGKENSKTTDSQHKGERRLFFGSKKSLFGGILAGSIALGGQWLVGQVYSGYEARQLLEAVASSSLYLGGSVVTASATIIALMLTMISLTRQTKGEFDSIFFKRIQRIGLLSTVALISGILLLLFLSIPLQESNKVPAYYFKPIYYILIVFVAGLSGLLVSIVLMLMNAIDSLIDVVRPSTDEDVEDAKEREEKESEREKEQIDKSADS